MKWHLWFLNWLRKSLHMRKVTASRMRERYAQTVPTFRLTYVFKKYVHQTCNDKSPLLLATLLCLSPEYLLRSISGERPTVVANMKGYHFSLISFLHRICVQFYIWNTSWPISRTYNSFKYKVFHNSVVVCMKTELLLSQVCDMLQCA